MPRQRRRTTVDTRSPRSIHTHKSDLGQALFRISRSNNHGPRPFSMNHLLHGFLTVKNRRGDKIGRNSKRYFIECVEELVHDNFLERHADKTLSITIALRARFRTIRQQIREANYPAHRITIETVKELKKVLGPRISREQLIRVNNSLAAELNSRPRAAPLQAWSSISTVDGNEQWGEAQVHVVQSQEQGLGVVADVQMDDAEEQEGRPLAGPSRSPIRAPTATNPARYYPSPESATRRPPNYLSNHSRDSQLQRRDAPATPTPAARLSRPGSKILSQSHGDDVDVGSDSEEEGDDRGEGPSGLQVRRILWAQSAQGGQPNADGAGHQCEHLRDLEDVRRQLEKKSHDEKAVRSEKESLSVLHNAVVAQRDAVSRERDAIRTDRDAVVLERNYISSQRDALRTRNGVLEGENATLVAEKVRWEEEKAAWEKERVELKEQVTQLQGELEELQREKGQWEAERVRNNAQKREMEERIRVLEAQVAAIEIDCARAEADKNRLMQDRRADAEHIVRLQQMLDETRASLDQLKADFQALKNAHAAIQRDLDVARRLLRQRSDELEHMNVQLRDTTSELFAAQSDLHDLHIIHEDVQIKLGREIEELQAAKQLWEQDKRDLNAIIQERDEELNECKDALVRYGRLAQLINGQYEASLHLVSGHAV